MSGSDENIFALKKAFALDPDSPYLKMEMLFIEGEQAAVSLGDNPKDQKAKTKYGAYVKNLIKLVESEGANLWPRAYRSAYGGYEWLGMYNEAWTMLETAKKFEPFYADYDGFAERMKRRQDLREEKSK